VRKVRGEGPCLNTRSFSTRPQKRDGDAQRTSDALTRPGVCDSPGCCRAETAPSIRGPGGTLLTLCRRHHRLFREVAL